MISTKSITHGRQTGTDIARSRRFYDAVFGWPVLLEAARRIPQVSSTAPSSRRAMVREDWAWLLLLALLGGGDWSSSSWWTPMPQWCR